jgi:hypothetical protein
LKEFDYLPARFAVIAAGALVTISVTTTTSAATTAAVATTTTAAVTTAATAITTVTAATAGSAIGSRSGFINRQVTAAEVLAIKLLNCRGCIFSSRHFHKTKSARSTRHAIFNDGR